MDLSEFTAEQLRDEIRARLPSSTSREFVSDRPTQRDLFASVSDGELIRAVLRQQKLVYGVNARVEAGDATPAEQADAASVAGLFPADCLKPAAGGGWELELPTLGQRVSAHFGCPLGNTEPFSNQPVGPLCSGCLIAPDRVLTVGRFISEAVLKTSRFVFDFKMKPDGGTRRVGSDEVYAGIQVLDSEFDPHGEDWAIVRLDRSVVGRAPARLRRDGVPSARRPLHVIGHPLGLPLKVAGGAAVRGTSSPESFVANLDAYGGGPGSPVFDSETHDVEGMLVRGGAELLQIGGSVASLICPQVGCLGGFCTPASLIPLPGDEHPKLRLRRPYLRGKEVRECQELLTRHGLEVPADGVFGPKTRAAVRAFQRREGLDTTGIVDSKTRTSLRS